MTAIATQTINLDLRPHFNRQNNCIVYCSQYDNDLRNVVVNIADAGTAVNVSTYTIYIEGTKPDKKGFSYELTDIGGTVSNNVVTFPLQLQMTACAGITNAELVFYSGDDRVGSSNFILAVEKAGLADDIDVSETDIPAYVDGAQQAAQAAEDAKDAAVDAKDTAVAVAASIPADYTTLSNDVDDLKSAFNELINKTEYTWQNGYINNSASTVDINNVTVAGAWKHLVAPCVGGDVFTLTATGGGTPRAWAFIKADGTLISNAGTYASATDEILIAPANSAYLVSNDNGGTGYVFKGGYRIDDLIALIETTKTYSFSNNGYVDPNDGVYHAYGSGTYLATDLIPVQVGNGINIVGSGIGEQYAFYNASRTFISGHANLTNVHTQPLAVPTGAAYFRMSLMPSGLDASTLSVTVLPVVEVAKQLYDRYPRTDIVINCVGDSVTEGMGVDGDYTSAYGKAPYPARLYTILKDNGYDVSVNNYGHGGERIPDMAARIGAYPCVFLEDVTIPSDNTAVSLGTMVAVDGRVTGTKIAVPYADTDGNDYCVFFTQTNQDTNPLYVENTELTLTIGNNENYIKKRIADSKAMTIKAGEFLFTRDNRNPSVNVVMGGINDGASMTLKRYVDMMTACMNANGGKAVILGSTHLLCSTWSDVTGSSADEKWNTYHRACIEAFGNKFIDLYYEFPIRAVQIALDSGYWADKTTAQIQAIQAKLDAHIMPSELTVDGVEGNVHLNEVGYHIIGTLVFERLKRLNYIQKSE